MAHFLKTSAKDLVKHLTDSLWTNKALMQPILHCLGAIYPLVKGTEEDPTITTFAANALEHELKGSIYYFPPALDADNVKGQHAGVPYLYEALKRLQSTDGHKDLQKSVIDFFLSVIISVNA